MKSIHKISVFLFFVSLLALPVSAKGFWNKLLGKSSTTSSGSVGADREQFMLVSESDMNKAAAELNFEVAAVIRDELKELKIMLRDYDT